MNISTDRYLAIARGEGELPGAPAEVSSSPYVNVPAYDSLVGLGPGRFNEQHVEVSGQFAYSLAWIQQHGWRLEDLAVTFGEGESMRDTIFNGDRLLVHLSENDAGAVVSGRIYAIEDAHNGARVKRLFKLADGRILVRSDNKNGTFPDEYLTPDSGARIIGRVVDRSGPPL